MANSLRIRPKGILLWDEILNLSLKVYGAKIDRQEWLMHRLRPFVDFNTMERLYHETPMEILPEKLIDHLAKEEIRRHTRMVTTGSAASGLLGGLSLWVGVPADIVQYYTQLIALVQKIAYLYGWQDLMPHAEISPETQAQITLMIGGAMGIPNANRALRMTEYRQNPITATEALRQEEGRTTYNRIVAETAMMLSIQISKSIASGVIAKSIPLLGAISSGAISYYTFHPLGQRLRHTLREIARECRN